MNKKAGEFSLVLLAFLVAGTFVYGREVFEPDAMGFISEERESMPHKKGSFNPEFIKIEITSQDRKRYRRLKKKLRSV